MSEGIPFGGYVLLRRLAVGGYAEVFLARRAKQGGLPAESELVVIKRLPQGLDLGPEEAQAMLDEARIACQIFHPFIARVHDLGIVDGSVFLAMEYVHGVDLRRVVAEAQRRGITLPWAVATRIALCIGEALQYAHQLRSVSGEPLELVHRDVTPSNVMVAYTGVPKLIDFGVAHARGRKVEEEGEVHVKVAYAAPEQLRGSGDVRVDVYGLALTLYELLTGRNPFQRTTSAETAWSVLSEAIAPLLDARRDVPAPLAQGIHHGLEKAPEARPESIAAFRAELERALGAAGAYAGLPEIGEFMGQLFPEGARSDRPTTGG